MSVRMTALKPFANSRLTADKGGSTVVPGDAFSTDWMHARELTTSGLAEAANPADLKAEPHDAVAPHNQLSVAEHRAVNDRRAKLRGDAAPAADVAAALPAPAGAITSASATRAAAPAAATGAAPAAATGGPRTNAPALPPVPNPTEPKAG